MAFGGVLITSPFRNKPHMGCNLRGATCAVSEEIHAASQFYLWQAAKDRAATGQTQEKRGFRRRIGPGIYKSPAGTCTKGMGTRKSPAGICKSPLGTCGKEAGTCKSPLGTRVSPVGTCAQRRGNRKSPAGTWTKEVGTCMSPAGTCNSPTGTFTSPEENRGSPVIQSAQDAGRLPSSAISGAKKMMRQREAMKDKEGFLGM